MLFHIRLGALFCILWAVDFGMFLFAVESTLANGVGGTVLFASEVSMMVARLCTETKADITLLAVCHLDGQCP